MEDPGRKERLEWALSELVAAYPEDPSAASAAVAPEVREGWAAQWRNRPRIHKAIDTALAYRIEERLASMPTLVELTTWVMAIAEMADSAAEVAVRLPREDRGRVKADAMEDLFCIACHIVFFLSAEGYPDRREVPRILRKWERDFSEGRDPEAGDGPIFDKGGGAK